MATGCPHTSVLRLNRSQGICRHCTQFVLPPVDSKPSVLEKILRRGQVIYYKQNGSPMPTMDPLPPDPVPPMAPGEEDYDTDET